jgi:hypothetical protein
MGAKHPTAGPTNYDHEAWSDWLGFCGHLGKPIFPSDASDSDEAATRAQILAFIAYSTAQLSATADAALAKVQAVGRQLELRDHPNHCFGPGSQSATTAQAITETAVGFGLQGSLAPEGCSPLRCFAPAGMQEAARAHCSGLLTSTECQSIDLNSVPALARALLDTQSRSQPASIHFLAHAWHI